MNPPLLRSWRWALGIGAVVGALIGGGIGSRFPGFLWTSLGAGIGFLLGAVCGLDLLLPSPKRDFPSDSNGRGPFTSTVMLGLGSMGMFLASVYSVGRLTFELQRADNGEVALIRRTTAWWDRVESSRQILPQVDHAVQARPDRVVVHRRDNNELPGVYDTVPEDMAEQINSFLKSDRPSLQIECTGLNFFPYLFFVLGVVCGVLSVRCLRWGISMLRTEFPKSEFA